MPRRRSMTSRVNAASRPRTGGGEADGKGRRVSYVAVLSCGHVKTFLSPAPAMRSYVTCGTCWKSARVDMVSTENRARCQDCPFSRPYGRALYLAEKGAKDHSQAKGHRVDVWEGSRKTFTYKPEGSPDQLTLDSAEEPPF
jgi:DNA-directed RNA polymerase subunit RPC12/RpoP